MKCSELVAEIAAAYRRLVSDSYIYPSKALENGNSFHIMMKSYLEDPEKRACLLNTHDRRILEMFSTMYTQPEKEELFGKNWRYHLRN